MKNLIGEKLKEKLLKNRIKYIFIFALLFYLITFIAMKLLEILSLKITLMTYLKS